MKENSMSSGRTPKHRYLRRIAALNKRVDFLIERINDAEKNGRDLTFDKSELGAIVWCINIIEENPEIALRTLRLEKPKEERNTNYKTQEEV